ncbi:MULTISPECIES: acyclic terpene utilization AtuA family protein [Porphyromonas]|uniref:acyclic terpene utilization AtuA family protein n=1 Tax=Porphyromonas TaxID=836 RepID=UPI00051D0BFE|nr:MULTISPECIES: acyclic terpene utilization AtuA family protein [Porphyromonas]KGL53807.1 3-methylaspartate ammonia-lyase [Porphyromonas canoris]KGN67331.1 3-methylaspartate ammonia-lyase [Porphyromonas sp. COT-108 OH1349]
MEEIRVLSPTAILGYGFPEESFLEGMKRNPDVIAVDAGSTDPGPYYLGAGKSFTDRNSVKRDLEYMIPAGVERNIPVIIGSAGGAGGHPHVEFVLDIVREIAKEKQLSFKMAVIESEFKKDFILSELRKGNITPLKPAKELTEKDVEESVRIVAQMGEEPIIEALKNGANVIVAGRAYDPSVFSALAISRGYEKGLAIHMGKILECAAIAALPGSGSDCMFGYLRRDHFELETLSPLRKCTTLSVAAHTLYEKSNPYILPGPGGAINLHETKFEQVEENRVRVSGSRFEPTEEYFVKLEGVRKVGYRTISCAAVKDPILISKIDEVKEKVKERVVNNFDAYGIRDFFLDFKVYGKNGTMAIFEDRADEYQPRELLIIIEAVAATQEQADTICGFARSTMLHYGYEGRISTAGNLAFPFSPSDCHVGEVFEFNVYHLLKVADATSLFPARYEVFNQGISK